jgi:hypothetical protein
VECTSSNHSVTISQQQWDEFVGQYRLVLKLLRQIANVSACAGQHGKDHCMQSDVYPCPHRTSLFCLSSDAYLSVAFKVPAYPHTHPVVWALEGPGVTAGLQALAPAPRPGPADNPSYLRHSFACLVCSPSSA